MTTEFKMIPKQPSNERFLAYLLVVQILVSGAALYSVARLAEVIIFESDKPTMTCPNGRNIYMAKEITGQCVIESIQLYAPQWAVPISRVAGLLSIMCIVLGVGLWLVGPKVNLTIPSWKWFYIQFAVFVIMLLAEFAMYPASHLFRLMIYGLDPRYFWP